MRIRNATNADLSAVESLLSESDLPLDGVRENFSSFVQILERAEEEAIDDLYLLTTTAETRTRA